jgi:hypothetical protein
LNAFATSRRYAVCSGWSAVSIVDTRGIPSAIASARRRRSSSGSGMRSRPNSDE